MSSDSTQSNEEPVVPVVPVFPVLERWTTRPACPPSGTAFSLGWLMAELFDPRRRASETVRQPPFDSGVQLPQVPDLEPDPKLVFLAADLAEIAKWYPAMATPTAAVTRETDKLTGAVDSEAASIGDAAAAGDAAEGAIAGAAAELTGGAAGQKAVAAAEETGAGPGFSAGALLTAVSELNQAILDDFADTPERLSAYQLGLALSDLTWLPHISPAGQPESAWGKPSALFGLFSRTQLATTKTLLNGAGSQLPASAAAIVSQSLDNWADWLEVNAANITASGADAWSAKGDAGAAGAAHPGIGLVLRAHRRPGRIGSAVHGRVGTGGVLDRAGDGDDELGHPAPVLAAGADRAGGPGRAARPGDREPQRCQPGLGVPGDGGSRGRRQRRWAWAAACRRRSAGSGTRSGAPPRTTRRRGTSPGCPRWRRPRRSGPR